MNRFCFSCTLLITITILIAQTSNAGAQQTERKTWYSMEEAQLYAEQEQKKVLIYAEAQWCGYCKKMNRNVFPTEAVQDSIRKYFYPVRIDVESEKKLVFNGEVMTQQQFAYRQKVRSTPTMFFVRASGEIIGRQPGYMPPELFSKLLSFVGSDAFGTISFEDYLDD